MKTTPDFLTVSEITVSYRPAFKIENRTMVNTSQQAFSVLTSAWNQDKIELIEQSYLLLLNRANHVNGIVELSSGGTACTVVDLKLMFAIALKSMSAKIILAHNHPSGLLEPSQEDIALTRRLVEAGKLLELPVIDHLIVTASGYFSFADEGLI